MKTVNKGKNKSRRFNKGKGWSERCSRGGLHKWKTSKGPPRDFLQKQ